MLGVVGAIVLLTIGAIGFWSRQPPLVEVNFISDPYEATIYLDDRQWIDITVANFTFPAAKQSVDAVTGSP